MNATGARLTIMCLGLMAIGVVFTTIASAEIDPGSIAGLWLFDEGSGNVIRDSSGNKHDGDLDGDFKWVEGRFGTALEFGGAGFAQLRNSTADLAFGGVEPFSITVWVENQGGGTVIGKFNGGIIGAYILAIGGGGTVTFHREVAPWGLSGSKALPVGDFGHVAVTYDGAEMKIYVNGKFDINQARGAQNTDLVTPVLIGGRFTQGKPSEFFRGVLDEVALFNVALTEEQILEVMRGLSPKKAVCKPGKLVSAWGNIKF